MDDIILNKVATIERCLERIESEYKKGKSKFKSNFTIQDAIILNIERACQASIDLATHLVRKEKLGIPQKSRDAFQLLEKKGKLSKTMSQSMQKMVGFRNLAVHDYSTLNLDIVESIIKNHLDDFRHFTQHILAKWKPSKTD